MPGNYFIFNARIVNEGEIFDGGLIIKDGLIRRVLHGSESPLQNEIKGLPVFDARGKHVIPGVIDDQVHFREPGLTHKGEIWTESRAAVAGGVTSFMDMPNVVPQTLTQDLLEERGYVGIKGPVPVLQQAFQDGYILNGEEWMKLKKSRENTSHTYNKEVAEEIVQNVIDSYYPLFQELITRLEKEIDPKGQASLL